MRSIGWRLMMFHVFIGECARHAGWRLKPRLDGGTPPRNPPARVRI
jgi:hypothetical protein